MNINNKWLISIIAVLVVGFIVAFLLCRYVWQYHPDTTAPKVTINALTPDPTSNNTPTLVGMAMDGRSLHYLCGYSI